LILKEVLDVVFFFVLCFGFIYRRSVLNKF